MTQTIQREEIAQKIKELGPWFHNLDIHGFRTAPDHFLGDYPQMKWNGFRHAIPADLSGKSVLDIGCNAGFYAMEMKRRGASRVLGVDSDDRYLNQARFAAETLGYDIEFRKLSIYDIHRIGERFDLVLFMGVLYHLRHPLLALDLLWEYAVGDMLVFQSLQRGTNEVFQPEDDYDFNRREIFDAPGYPLMYFVEKRYSHDPTNWWIPNSSCTQAMLRSAGFAIIEHPEEEVFVCRRAERQHFGIASREFIPAAFEVKK